MSREEKLFSAIGGVPDALVNEAADPGEPGRKRPSWARWGALAASLVLVVGLVRFFPRMGGASGGAGQGIGGDAAPGEVEFMHYAGPVLPLTVVDGPEGLPATREVTWDFDAGANAIRVEVSDVTVITNDRDGDLTITIGYPVTASLSDREELFPTLTVNGETLTTSRLWGDQKTSTRREEPVWTPRIESWEDCKAALEDPSYLAEARKDPPALEQTVTVWEVTDEAAGEWDRREMAPTLAITFRVDDSRTKVYAYGFNGYDSLEDGSQRHSFFVRENGEREYTRYLIFLGEAPERYTMEGYTDGGCDRVLEGVTGRLNAFTITLGELLDRLVMESREELDRLGELRDAVRRQMDRVLTDPRGADYYFMLEDVIGHAFTTTRVMWTTAQVTIPRGESVTITARYEKGPSYDFACADTQRKGLNGWDLAARLGSSLNFTRITARLENTQGIEVVRDDFGFDQRAGVLEVELAPGQEHFAMEIRAKGE